ncbi:MAG: hypothetical protein E5Y86_32200 [Mesorhizobium sp.]|nr:MAG: hypothetical protein E5Y86_32200 [Mesorhizobium sp.]
MRCSAEACATAAQNLSRRRRDSALLCPTGHLPHLGGDRLSSRLANFQHRSRSAAPKLPISPLVGEMPSFGKEGRTEGGAKDRQPSWFRARRIAGRRFHR